MGDLLNSGRPFGFGNRRAIIGKASTRVAAVWFCHVASKNGTKLLSTDRMIIKLCLQLS